MIKYMHLYFEGIFNNRKKKLILLLFLPEDMLCIHNMFLMKKQLASVAHSDACLTGDQQVTGSIPTGSCNIIL